MVRTSHQRCTREPTGRHIDDAAAVFHLLSAPIRLRLLWWLLHHPERDVTALAAAVGAKVPAVSQHLAKLRLAGLVSARTQGAQHIYTVDDPHVAVLIEQVLDHITDITDTRPRQARRAAPPT
jgi:DNA-binding transcriptional ArsR family regulator